MRQVATGDPPVQPRKQDPFAVPARRAPVVRPPLGFVALVQAARVVGRLVRFLFRHPIAVLAVIVGILVWRETGWPVLAAVAATAVFGLGDLVVVVPGLVRPVHRCPFSWPVAG